MLVKQKQKQKTFIFFVRYEFPVIQLTSTVHVSLQRAILFIVTVFGEMGILSVFVRMWVGRLFGANKSYETQ